MPRRERRFSPKALRLFDNSERPTLTGVQCCLPRVRPIFQTSSRIHRLRTKLSKNRTNFFGSVLASMALTQRLEFRQSQSLVMTPQLMQAIKLLQLSNLD